MNSFDFLAPVLRKKNVFIYTFFAAIFLFGIIQVLIPNMSRTIVYFSVKPLAHTENSAISDPADSAEKVADTLAGWAKDPAFRNQILNEGDFYIDNLKQKLTARKQNRMNVFWTTTLYEEERALEKTMAGSLIKTINKNINDYNQNNTYPILIGTPRVSHQIYEIPAIWYWVGAILIAFFAAGLLPLILETLAGKISHNNQLDAIKGTSPILHVSEKLGKHDQQLIDQYLQTFDSPRLIGTFPIAEKHFSLAPAEAINEAIDTPVLLVRMGDTSLRELANMQAIFGENVGLIVFEN